MLTGSQAAVQFDASLAEVTRQNCHASAAVAVELDCARGAKEVDGPGCAGGACGRFCVRMQPS